MSRDPDKLKVFHRADALVVDVYRVTKRFPAAERYGLQSQLRRAAVSVPTNIVEGCARASTREYAHFVTVALGSASEVRYLLGLSARLGLLTQEEVQPLTDDYTHLLRALQGLLTALHGAEA